MSGERRRSVLAPVLLVPAPSLGAGAALWAFPGPLGQAVFALCKVWLVGFPLLWLLWVERGRPALPAPSARGLPAALGTGFAIAAAIRTTWALVPAGWLDPEAMRDRARHVGIATRAVYVAGAAGWCLGNSLIEEYVWRWFVLRQCVKAGAGAGAVPLSAALFTVHHVVALPAWCAWPLTLVASLGVLAGGWVWGALYRRYGTVWPGWISHALSDAAIFAIGYEMLFGRSPAARG